LALYKKHESYIAAGDTKQSAYSTANCWYWHAKTKVTCRIKNKYIINQPLETFKCSLLQKTKTDVPLLSN
jgi:hypothetical protein